MLRRGKLIVPKVLAADEKASFARVSPAWDSVSSLRGLGVRR